MHPKKTAATLLLLLGLAAAAPPEVPSPADAFSKIRTFLGGLNLQAAQERIQDAYTKGSEAVMTYTGILGDQLYHWWQGEQ
ncbi:apolipoprotein C-II-like [Cuculus canorus]|uniref:apolipoprotein C-II-like n=1 Tax=Cuculus canorus TaxID=55661 RepID=UPI0023AA8259|nr:apolipoprotein C-II-like [Cuculus canorus]